jgi:GNAT superfamily N-acetyltransferase
MSGDPTRIAESPGRWLPDDGQTSVVARSGFDFVTFGKSAAVESIQLAGDAVASAVANARALLRERGLAKVTWWVGPSSSPADLERQLLACGLTLDDDPDLTLLSLDRPPAGSSNLEVRRVTTRDEFVAALALESEAFGNSPEETAERVARGDAAWERLKLDGTVEQYVAYLDGRAVGFGRGVYTPEGGLLLGGATLPDARGHGVYTALVNARWDAAVQRGTPRLIVAAGPMSGPILARLGFTSNGTVRLIVDRL